VTEIILDVVGIPKAQARPRVYLQGGKPRAHSPKAPWHTLVSYAAMLARDRGESCLTGATRVELEFRMPRVSGLPKSREVPHTKKPDLDNMCKVIDSLVPALLVDDRQVVQIVASKRYALAGEAPGCRIVLSELEFAAREALRRGREGCRA
jgi:Holliday junction resolvase RusA-like endonuclease